MSVRCWWIFGAACAALFLLGGCADSGESSKSIGTLATITEHRVVSSNAGIYRCFVYRGIYKGGMWCEKASVGTPPDRVRQIRRELMERAGL